jgi:lipoate-protein ligase A
VKLRILQDPPGEGAALMAEDAALLERAERGDLTATLRFYQWSEPTVSLGFHQSEEILDGERLRAAYVPWVRRPTGGAAVLHSEELTYAIVLPCVTDAVAAARVQELVSRAIAWGLRAVGVEAEADARGEAVTALPNRSSCFVRTSRWEVTACGRKIVGSAQRRLTQALLQHGSILTGDDHLRITDFLRVSDESERGALRRRLSDKATSVAAEVGHTISMDTLRRAMAESFCRVFAQETSARHAYLSEAGG